MMKISEEKLRHLQQYYTTVIYDSVQAHDIVDSINKYLGKSVVGNCNLTPPYNALYKDSILYVVFKFSNGGLKTLAYVENHPSYKSQIKYIKESKIHIEFNNFKDLISNDNIIHYESFNSINPKIIIPEITYEKDSIPDLTKRLIELSKSELGLKCKITYEPFET